MNVAFPPDTDLCSVVLRASGDWMVVPTHGRHLHAAFLRWIAAFDRALAVELHAPSQVRPYTVALLPPGGDNSKLAIRCSLLGRRLIDAVRDQLAAGTMRLRLGAATYDFLLDASDPWSGVARWHDLTAADGQETDIRLEFVTPTCFNRSLPGERKELAMFPQPELVWDSWARKWRTFGPPLPDLTTAGSMAARWVLVSNYRLETQTVNLDRFRQKGFLGWVDYELQPDTPPDVARTLNMLARFASFAGTGYKTAMGLGLTQRRT